MSEVRLWRIAWHHHTGPQGYKPQHPSRAARGEGKDIRHYES